MTNGPIATSAIECNKLFDKLSSQLQDEEWEKRTALLKPAVQKAIDRYKFWADRFCALQEPSETSSLDHRVKEYSDVIDCYHSSLAELKDALEKLIAIASGERR
jgi:benzoyl-CoA reductase/2-hydroxyglutaryl-CoA dehydratase subunit BcrC/BadD/HgdB